jgi:3-hydroxyisobutyrate dehydrogenase-like beta-hydroxyacid dehydrogenase
MLAEAARLRASMPALAAVREVCQSARAQGLGQEDIIAIAKVLERSAGIHRA